MSDIFTSERVLGIGRAVLILVVGVLVARVASRTAERGMRRHVSAQEAMLVRRLSYYVLLGIVVASALHQLGFKLGVLLGAAGVISVALGFASQTSVSNLISGLFLIVERSFVVGDLLEVNGRVGSVISIDLLSVKLRTFDNLMMRVPNEEMTEPTRPLTSSRSPTKKERSTIKKSPLMRLETDVCEANPRATEITPAAPRSTPSLKPNWWSADVTTSPKRT